MEENTTTKEIKIIFDDLHESLNKIQDEINDAYEKCKNIESTIKEEN